MALIKCPKCGKQISEHAERCPHCGISKEDARLLIKQKERAAQIAAEREAAERERQRQEYLAKQESLRKEREAKEAEEARIRAEKRAEWWKANKKKVWISIAIFVVLILAVIAINKIQNTIAEKELNQRVEAAFLAGDSCVNVFAFDEAENFYQQAMELRNDEETRNRIVQKLAEMSNVRTKADDEYNAALRRLKLLLAADDNEFNQYSNACLDKMIEIYPDRQETIYYKNIRGK